MTSRTGDLAFVPEDTPEGDDFEALPRGEYPAQIVEAEVVVNKAQNGRNLRLKYKVNNTERSLQEWLAVDNPGEKAQEIARGKLAKLSRMTGLTGVPAKAEKLLGRKLNLRLDVEESTNIDGKKYINNVIKGYKEFDGSAAPTPVAAKSNPVARKEPETIPAENGTRQEIPFDDDDIPF